MAYLEYGVLVLVLGRVSRGVLPRDPKAHGVTVDPLQAGISPAVHLGDQPRLQTDTSRRHRHGETG